MDEMGCEMAAALGLKSNNLRYFTFVLVPDVEGSRLPTRGDTFSLTDFERRANRVVLVAFLVHFIILSSAHVVDCLCIPSSGRKGTGSHT